MKEKCTPRRGKKLGSQVSEPDQPQFTVDNPASWLFCRGNLLNISEKVASKRARSDLVGILACSILWDRPMANNQQ